MTPPRLALLALAALLATGGAFWLSSQRHLERATGVGDPVLPQLRAAINEVAEVRVSRGDGTAATLRRGPAGWTVVERGWPADSGKVRKLLLDLSALAIVEEKTHDAARYAVLGVEDVAGPAATGTRVDVKTARGAIQSLVIGKPSGAREGFVRAVGAAPSYLARPQVAAEPNPARWLDTALLDVDAPRVRAVTLQAPGAAARTLEDASLPPALAGALDGLVLEDVRPRALGPSTAAAGAPAEPTAHRARFTTVDGLVLELLGREDGARRWISVAARFEAAAARPRAAAAAGPASPSAAGAAAPPAAAAPEQRPPDPQAEARAIQQRAATHEFEIPAYRFGTLFDVAAASGPASFPPGGADEAGPGR